MTFLLNPLVSLLGTLSVLVAVLAGAVGVLLVLLGLGGGGGGFISFHDGVSLGLWLLGAGNLVCLLLNVLILCLRKWHWELDWLRNLVVRLQLAPAAIFLVAAAIYLVNTQSRDRALAQVDAVRHSLATVSADAEQAFRACTGRCMRYLDADQQLLLAAQYQRLGLAELAAQRGGRVNRLQGVAAQLSQPIACGADVTLYYANALELAIVHDDAELMELILPLTDDDYKMKAVKTSATLGRQALLRRQLEDLGQVNLPRRIEEILWSEPELPTRVATDSLVCQLPVADPITAP